MSGNPHLLVDQDVCIGAGRCVLSAPEVFDQGDDGLVRLADAGPATGPGDRVWAGVEQALATCPSGAIRRADPVTQD